ncbi:hypothetical protein J6590_057392, partial [Homalodisca vitripennis]
TGVGKLGSARFGNLRRGHSINLLTENFLMSPHVAKVIRQHQSRHLLVAEESCTVRLRSAIYGIVQIRMIRAPFYFLAKDKSSSFTMYLSRFRRSPARLTDTPLAGSAIDAVYSAREPARALRNFHYLAINHVNAEAPE